jgi:hydroxymethylglutaryl-CoA synthase
VSDDRSGPGAITGVGVYAPQNRLPASEIEAAWERVAARGVESVAVPGPDEDSLTMAAAAAERALDAADCSPDSVEFLAFATTTPPVEEPELTPRLGAFLGLPESADRRSLGGGTRAGTEALATAVEAVEPADHAGGDDVGPALVVASDAPLGEPNSAAGQAAGAGAAAVVVERGTDENADRPTATIHDRSTAASDYPGARFRQRGTEETESLGITSYERAAFGEPVASAVETLDSDVFDPATADSLAITAPDGDRPARAASTLELDTDRITTPVRSLGDTGAASALLGLARAFESAETAAETTHRTLLVGVGSGGSADATLLTGTAPVAGSLAGDCTLSYTDALRLREEITSGPPAGGGAAVSVPTWRRSRAARYRLVAGRCPECGALAFPPDGACSNCRELVEYERVQLPSEGEIVTVTGISPGGAPPEFVPQAERGGDFPVGIVRFERDGKSVDVPMQVCDEGSVGDSGDEVSAGDRVAWTVRRVYEQEGVVRYGAKARRID